MKLAIAENDGVIWDLLRGSEAVRGLELIRLNAGDYSAAGLDDPELRIAILAWASPAHRFPDLCQRLRLRGLKEPYVYILALVEDEEDSAHLEAFKAGVDGVVTTSSDPGVITAQIEVARRILAREDELRQRSSELEQIQIDLQTENAALAEIATRDALTGLRNFRFFHEALNAQYSLARRKGMPLSLAMIDVDQFKAFNDMFGHPAGDEVLRELGHLLRSCVRDHDIVARYGGEEFAILFPATDEDETQPVIDRLLSTVAQHPWPLRPMTISIGVTTQLKSETRPDDLVDQADRALYFSKALGRNRATQARDLRDLASPPLADRHSVASTIPRAILRLMS